MEVKKIMNIKEIHLDESLDLRPIGQSKNVSYLYGYNDKCTHQYIYCYKSKGLDKVLETSIDNNISLYWDINGEVLYFIQQQQNDCTFSLNMIENNVIKFIYKFEMNWIYKVNNFFIINEYAFIMVKENNNNITYQWIMVDMVNNKYYDVKGIDFIDNMVSTPKLLKKNEDLYVVILKSYLFPNEVPDIRKKNLSKNDLHLVQNKLLYIKFDVLINNIKNLKGEYDWNVLLNSQGDEYIDFVETCKNCIICIYGAEDKKHIIKIDSKDFNILKYNINNNINQIVKTDDDVYFVNINNKEYIIYNTSGDSIFKNNFNDDFYNNSIRYIFDNRYIIIKGHKDEGDDDRVIYELVDMITKNKVYYYNMIVIGDNYII